MEGTLGLVVPAYKPDVSTLTDYVQALHDRLGPEAIRIELDDPGSEVGDRLVDLPATVATADRRRGKGAAITHGWEQLDTDILAFVDADGSTPPESVAAVIEPVHAGSAALVVGSRRHPDATVVGHQTLVRRRLGDAFATVAGHLLDVALSDYQCGAKAISRTAWQDVRHHLYERGFAWDVELVAMTAALGYRVSEVPIVWEDRPGSTVSPIGTSFAMARGLFSARHRARLLQGDRLHGALDAWAGNRTPLVPRPERVDET